MSSAPESTRMPYELAAEEIRAHVSPLLGLGERKPRIQKWIKRSVLVNEILLRYDGHSPVLVTGRRGPVAVISRLRRDLTPTVGGKMPELLGSFEIRDTVFTVTELPAGEPIEDSSKLPDIALALAELDAAYRDGWGERPYPEGITETILDSSPLEKIGKRLGGDPGELAAELADRLADFSRELFEDYPRGLIHGDPGVDNAFAGEDGVTFTGGPGELGPGIVDVAYLMQSAAACLEDFDPGPTISSLADYYGKSEEKFEEDLRIADIAAHINLAAWFDRCATELMTEYDELYDHLLEARIRALDSLV